VSDDERDILLARYFDGSATAEQLEALDRAAAADPGVARAMFAAAGEELSLRDALAVAPNGMRIANSDSTPLPLVNTRVEKGAPAPLRGWWTTRVRTWTSIAAGVLLAAGITYWVAHPATTDSRQFGEVKPLPPQPLATFTVTGPGVTIERGGIARPGGSDTVISSQDIVATGFAPASFVYDQEQTVVTIAGQSKVALVGDATNKQLNLLGGSVSCEVQKQKLGHPLIVTTPQARVQVVGTQFDVTSHGGWTRVDVSHGTVRVTRASDGATVDVSAGEYIYCGKPTASAPSSLPPGFTVAKGRDMAPYWSTKVRPAGIEH
jgi:hypothetical protein